MRVCDLLVGLGDIDGLGVEEAAGEQLRVHVRRWALRPPCGCGGPLWSNAQRPVKLVGPVGVRPVCAAGVAQASLALRSATL